jgi:hypothetical protein
VNISTTNALGLLFAGLHREGNLSSFLQMPMIWSRGEWVEEKHFCVSAMDRGVLHGLGAFETMLAIDGVIQHREKHLRRLQGAIERMGLCDISSYDFSEIGRELCEKNFCASGRARLRLTVTAGEGSLAHTTPGDGAMVGLTAQALAATAPTCKVVTLPWTRNERSSLAGLKISWLYSGRGRRVRMKAFFLTPVMNSAKLAPRMSLCVLMVNGTRRVLHQDACRE